MATCILNASKSNGILMLPGEWPLLGFRTHWSLVTINVLVHAFVVGSNRLWLINALFFHQSLFSFSSKLFSTKATIVVMEVLRQEQIQMSPSCELQLSNVPLLLLTSSWCLMGALLDPVCSDCACFSNSSRKRLIPVNKLSIFT